MSRTDEVNKMTENVYKGILDQFNPSLKNFVTMGKHYEKALTGVTVAAKGYFDALVKLGELASDSQGSKELGDTLFQMAEVHRQIQVQLEDVLKLFHSELLAQLEQKLELDIKYLTATLKKYQGERAAVPETLLVAAVVLSAHQAAGARAQPAASHCASGLGRRRDRRGPPPHQTRLGSA
uniref:IMD domain-containing protein n=1 Tax=Salarias fasciatus TaxID=181472 RepID=A0A672HS02_SALFA